MREGLFGNASAKNHSHTGALLQEQRATNTEAGLDPSISSMLNNSIDAGQRRWILVALMMTMMLAAMDTTIVSTAIPQIVGDLGGFALFTWVFSIYLLAQTVTIPIYGKLADMFGRKPVLIIGALIFLAGSAASAFAWDMLSLIVFRGLQGLGAGSIMATVNTLAGDLYSVRERARIQGWLSSVWGVAAIIGPTLDGAFAEYASWHWIFLVNLPIGAAAIALIARFLHEQPQHHRHRIDHVGATLMLLAGSVLIFALLQGGQAWPWRSAPSVIAFASAALLIAATVQVERHAIEPIVPPWLWRHRVLALSNLAMVGMGLMMMGPNTYLPTFGQATLGLGAIAAGFLLASMSIGWPLASSWSGHLYLRIDFRNTALIGGVLIALAAFGFLLLPYPAPIGGLVGDQILLGAGFGLLSTPLLVGVQSMVDWQDRGVVTGANIFSRYLGQSLGAAAFGTIFNQARADALTHAPSSLRTGLPHNINAVIGALHQVWSTPTCDRRSIPRRITSMSVSRSSHCSLSLRCCALPGISAHRPPDRRPSIAATDYLRAWQDWMMSVSARGKFPAWPTVSSAVVPRPSMRHRKTRCRNAGVV